MTNLRSFFVFLTPLNFSTLSKYKNSIHQLLPTKNMNSFKAHSITMLHDSKQQFSRYPAFHKLTRKLEEHLGRE